MIFSPPRSLPDQDQGTTGIQPRGIKNRNHNCAIIAFLQMCFHVPSLLRILQAPLPKPWDLLRLAFLKYSKGSGPLDLLPLATPPTVLSQSKDTGELLARFLSAAREGQLALTFSIPWILHLKPEDTLLQSLRDLSLERDRPSPTEVMKEDTFIFQLDRMDMMGSKNRKKTKFPVFLGQEHLKLMGSERGGEAYALQAVVVHSGGSGRGHYVTYLNRKTDHRWTLFDDHQVQEVPEELVCNQEATLLVYSRLRELREGNPKKSISNRQTSFVQLFARFVFEHRPDRQTTTPTVYPP